MCITTSKTNLLFRGVWRVEGVLAVSRAIGDRPLKEFVTSEPHIKEKVIDDNDSFLILATDGLWDVLENKDVAELMLEHGHEPNPARLLVERAYTKGSGDNICAIAIDLKKPLGNLTS